MIKPVTRKFKMEDVDDDFETIDYWLSRSPNERIDAMGYLHKQMIILQGYKEIPRIEKTTRKVKNIT